MSGECSRAVVFNRGYAYPWLNTTAVEDIEDDESVRSGLWLAFIKILA
jgi:hypothetical protein